MWKSNRNNILMGSASMVSRKRHHDRILQQAHALVVLRIVTSEKGVNQHAADDEEAADHRCSEDALAQFEVIPKRSGKSRLTS